MVFAEGNIENHMEPKEYTLKGEAYEAYRQAHDKLVDKKMATDNQNLQGMYAKSRATLHCYPWSYLHWNNLFCVCPLQLKWMNWTGKQRCLHLLW